MHAETTEFLHLKSVAWSAPKSVTALALCCDALAAATSGVCHSFRAGRASPVVAIELTGCRGERHVSAGRRAPYEAGDVGAVAASDPRSREQIAAAGRRVLGRHEGVVDLPEVHARHGDAHRQREPIGYL